MCGWSDSVATEFLQRGPLERLDVDLDSCPAEFSITCTRGGRVDMLNDFGHPQTVKTETARRVPQSVGNMDQVRAESERSLRRMCSLRINKWTGLLS